MTATGTCGLVGVVIAALTATPTRAATPEQITALQELPSKERAKLVGSLSRDELAKHLATIPPEALLRMGQREVDELGVYALRVTKDELVDGAWTGPQTMDLEVRESPLAIKGSVTHGPATGRRLLYNAALNKTQLRVHEPGLLGIAGAVWIDVDSRLARGDTRHPITDLCYGALFRILQDDFKKGAVAGGHTRTDLGFDADGAYCIRFDAPKNVSGLYAREATLCLDPVKALLTRVEVSDASGPFEKLRYELLRANLPRTDADFTPEASGL